MCEEVGRKGYLSSKARIKEGGINKKGKDLSWQKYKVTRNQNRNQQGKESSQEKDNGTRNKKVGMDYPYIV